MMDPEVVSLQQQVLVDVGADCHPACICLSTFWQCVGFAAANMYGLGYEAAALLLE